MKAFLLAKGAKQLYSSGKIVATGRKIKFDINMYFLLFGSFGFLLLFSFPCHRDGSIINTYTWNFATTSTRKRAFINFDFEIDYWLTCWFNDINTGRYLIIFVVTSISLNPWTETVW